MSETTTSTTTNIPPDFPIPTTTTQANDGLVIVPVNQDDFDKYKRRQQRITSWTFGLITAAFLVCIIAVIGFLLDAWRFHSQTLQQYNQTVRENTRERENQHSLENVNMRNELQALKNRLDSFNIPVQPKIKYRKNTPIKINNIIKINTKDTVAK